MPRTAKKSRTVRFPQYTRPNNRFARPGQIGPCSECGETMNYEDSFPEECACAVCAAPFFFDAFTSYEHMEVWAKLVCDTAELRGVTSQVIFDSALAKVRAAKEAGDLNGL